LPIKDGTILLYVRIQVSRVEGVIEEKIFSKVSKRGRSVVEAWSKRGRSVVEAW